jgi:hypothetical protein
MECTEFVQICPNWRPSGTTVATTRPIPPWGEAATAQQIRGLQVARDRIDLSTFRFQAVARVSRLLLWAALPSISGMFLGLGRHWTTCVATTLATTPRSSRPFDRQAPDGQASRAEGDDRALVEVALHDWQVGEEELRLRVWAEFVDVPELDDRWC